MVAVFGKLLSWKIGLILFFILMVNMIYTVYETESFETSITEFGDKMVGSLIDFNDELEIIIENEQMINPESDSWWEKFLDVFTTYSSILWSIFAFILWVRGFTWILNSMNGSNKSGNTLIAIFIVSLINGIYIAGTRGMSELSIYIDIFKNFGIAFPYLFQPLRQVADQYYINPDINISNFSIPHVNISNFI